MLSDSLLVVACMSIYGELWYTGNRHLLFECTVICDTSGLENMTKYSLSSGMYFDMVHSLCHR